MAFKKPANGLPEDRSSRERESSSEPKDESTITFFGNVRAEEAKKIGIDPGIYFGLNQVEEEELEDTLLLHEVGPHIMSILMQEGFMDTHSQGETKIPLNSTGEVYTDPSAAWRLEYSLYFPDDKKLLIKAVNKPPEAENVILQALRRIKR